jgi:putative pyrroloquinoline-quinone binding quinoprotein
VNDDFITRLGQALREAADREEERTSRARAVRTARARVPRIARLDAVVALALGVVLLVGIYVLAHTRSEPAQPPKGPRVVARLTPGGGLGEIASGFGSAWVIDDGNDRLLRMDPTTRRVTARIGLRAAIGVGIGRDAVWVGEGVNDVLRIDPQTNKVVARIPLERGSVFSGGFPVPIGDAVWVVGRNNRVLRVDTRTNRITKAITVAPAGYDIRASTVLGGDLWLFTGDRRILRYDGRTGAPKAAFEAPFSGNFGALGDALYLADDNQAVRLDPATGRVVWSVPADQFGAAAEARALIWVETPGRNGDQVVAVNPRNGRIVQSVRVGEFSVMSMERIGSELWLTTAGGHLVILRL